LSFADNAVPAIANTSKPSANSVQEIQAAHPSDYKSTVGNACTHPRVTKELVVRPVRIEDASVVEALPQKIHYHTEQTGSESGEESGK
jgi:hypothetical protein